MATFRMAKVKQYPRPHNRKIKFNLQPDTSSKEATFIPILHNDEGLGDPASYQAHPEHSSFAEFVGSSLYPESRVNNFFAEVRLSLHKDCWASSNVENVRMLILPVYMSFKENYIAIDEKSTNEVQDCLELQFETTDRQGGALYNGTKLVGDSLELGTTTPFLTTNTTIEGITFDPEIIYDMLQYGTISGKLAKSMGQMKWFTVSRRRQTRIRIRGKLVSKVKRANDYTLCGYILYCPDSDDINQIGQGADFTTTTTIIVSCADRYNEWNDNFDMTKT